MEIGRRREFVRDEGMGREEHGFGQRAIECYGGLWTTLGEEGANRRQTPRACEEAEVGRHDIDPTQLASAGAMADSDEAGTARHAH